MRSTFKTVFYVNASKEKNGNVPIMGRVTINGTMTEKELRTMSSIKLDDPNLAFARDLFVFGCWTGISFIDIKNLTTDNVVETNGAQWIVSKRQKTGVPFRIKLMDIPKRIIKRYEPLRIDN